MSQPPPGKRVDINLRTDTFSSFLTKCSQAMDIPAIIIYDIHGFQITGLHELISQEIYYVSSVYILADFHAYIG